MYVLTAYIILFDITDYEERNEPCTFIIGKVQAYLPLFILIIVFLISPKLGLWFGDSCQQSFIISIMPLSVFGGISSHSGLNGVSFEHFTFLTISMNKIVID